MNRWRLTYRYRKEYERGGPWVYVECNPVAMTSDEREMRDLILNHLASEGKPEIITLECLYLQGRMFLGETKVIKAREA